MSRARTFPSTYPAEGNKDLYPELARRAVSNPARFDLHFWQALKRAFLAETSAIPMVTMKGDPVRQRLMQSIARPGGNLTGVSVDAGF